MHYKLYQSVSRVTEMAKTKSTQNSVNLSTPAVIEATPDKSGKALPPVHLWNPPYAGEIDIQIRRNGDWFHEGGKINRPEMVRLFASILRKEGDDFYLVTPVEKVKISVEDTPFVIVDLSIEGTGREKIIRFETNLGDRVVADAKHLVRLDPTDAAPTPYIMVRDGLDARLDRKTYYRVVESAEIETLDGEAWLGIWSRGVFLKLFEASALAD